MKLSLTLPVTLLCLAGAVQAAPVLYSGFNASPEGWTKVAEQTTSISHAVSGGNPGGYARNSDQGPTAGDILAPSAWLGDWRGYNGGLLSWDFRIFSLGVNDGRIFPVTATITGPGGTAVFDSGIVPTVAAGWFTVTAPVLAERWTVTAGSWTGALANVQEFKLLIEPVFSTNFPGEVSGIDNVMLSPVPAPPTALMLGFGLLALSLLRRRPG